MADINTQVRAMSKTAARADAGDLNTYLADQKANQLLGKTGQLIAEKASLTEENEGLKTQVNFLNQAINQLMLDHAQTANTTTSLAEQVASLQFINGSQGREIQSLTEQLNAALSTLNIAAQALHLNGQLNSDKQGKLSTSIAEHKSTVFGGISQEKPVATTTNTNTNSKLPTLTPRKGTSAA